jgi:hypothetical protein
VPISPHCIIWCGPIQSALPIFYPSGPGQADLRQPADSLSGARGRFCSGDENG